MKFPNLPSVNRDGSRGIEVGRRNEILKHLSLLVIGLVAMLSFSGSFHHYLKGKDKKYIFSHSLRNLFP